MLGVGGIGGGGGGIGGIGGNGMNAGGLNTLGHHQTMFFGPAHTLSQYSSLPRRSTNITNSAFQRNTPIRRSTGIPEHHMEYFVPRSISEFNLSGVGDLALPPPRRFSPNGAGVGGIGIGVGGIGGMHAGMPGMTGTGLPHGLQLGPPQTLLCAAGAGPPPPPQMQIVTLKPREKMVTFEDESKAMAAAAASAASVAPTSVTATHCPHGVPTTPRKTSTAGLLGGPGADIFM